MKTYEYQILRYIPDQVSGEFLNVGILMFGQKENTFCYEFIESRQRISAVFHGIESAHIMRKLKILREKLEDFEKHQDGKLPLQNVSGVIYYSTQILKKDDSALQFSEVKKGMDISIESAFRDLKNRLLYKWEGIISEMQTANEEMKLILLSEMPEKENGISEFIREHLNSKKEETNFSELITPENVDELLGKF